MQSETFTNFIHDVSQQVRELLNDTTPHNVASGILALSMSIHYFFLLICPGLEFEIF